MLIPGYVWPRVVDRVLHKVLLHQEGCAYENARVGKGADANYDRRGNRRDLGGLNTTGLRDI